MSKFRITINSEQMHRDGKWFEAWIITQSSNPPMVCLTDFSGTHTETIFARGQKFETLPNAPSGVSIRCFCKDNVPANCWVVISLEQEGMTDYEFVNAINIS